MMNRSLVIAILGLGLTFTAVPASAVVYCKTVGVTKGCVARPATGGNANGGVNRLGPLR